MPTASTPSTPSHSTDSAEQNTIPTRRTQLPAVAARGAGNRAGRRPGVLVAHRRASPAAPRTWTDELVEVPLGDIVHARSGDKGGDANLGIWVRHRDAWPWLQWTLTVDELRRLLPETRQSPISRYELPNLGAVNFVIRGLLGDGATSSLRVDAQAKALGEWLRARTAKVPRHLVES
jgi:hypothetical protein